MCNVMEHKTPEQIEWAAAQAGLTMKQVLAASRVSPSVWHDWKKGRSEMRPYTIVRLIKAIDGA
jgi:hypothetical protein